MKYKEIQNITLSYLGGWDKEKSWQKRKDPGNVKVRLQSQLNS